MKTLYLFILVGLTTKAFGQISPDACVRNISTNPVAPVNEEWPGLFPGKTENFTNTFFNWAPPPYGPTILIAKPQNWITPFPSQAGEIAMVSPFRNENSHGSDYLQTGDLIFRDWHWEDGWELLYMNLGYYPNGDKIDEFNPDHWLGGGFKADPNPNYAPYFILYNRYRGVLRVFANIWFADNSIGTEEKIIVELRLDGSERDVNDETSYSAAFRLANGMDKPLDQPTDIISLSSPKRHPTNGTSGNNTSQWVAADFQIAYDPCQCHIPTKLVVKFFTRDVFNVDLTLREISYDKNLNDLSDAEKDFFQTMLDANGDVVAAGNVAYASIDGLLDDYKKALSQYEDDMADYKSPVNQLKKLVVDAAKVGMSDGIANLAVPLGALKDFLLENKLKLWDDKLVIPKDSNQAEDWAVAIKNSLKKGMADQFDFLNTVLDIQTAPVKPQTPSATFTEGRITGNITKLISPESEPLFMPGTMPTASLDKYLISPHNFPVYNNVMGMFALLRTPRLKYYCRRANIPRRANQTNEL